MALDASDSLLSDLLAEPSFVSKHFDTAEIYKTGNPFADVDGDLYNEAVLSRVLSSAPRDSFTIATKYMPGKWGGKCDYDSVKSALQSSLARLKLDFVDVYYCHRITSEDGAVSFTASCARLIAEGLMKHVGLSEVCGSWLRSAHAVHPVFCIQQEWSLMTRNLEAELVPVCAKLGVGIVAYSPLARNLLTAPAERPTDWRASNPRFSEDNFAANVKLMKRVEDMALEKGVSAGQLSLAWLLHKARDLGVKCMPIPGTTKILHARENFKAVSITLTTEEMTVLEDLADNVVGARGDERYVSMGIEGQQ